MNQELRQQLKHPQARLRHEAIVQLARLKDEDALPLLNDISKNDPEPSLRQLAERAIVHILNEFSSTISRAQNQETPPSKIPPFSNAEAEDYIQNAYALYKDGSTANALQYLIKALDLSPLLVADFDVQLLAENLTGIEGAQAANLLADRNKRRQFFHDDVPSHSNKLPGSPSALIIFILFLIVLSQFFLADGIEFMNQAFDEFGVQQLKQSARQVNGINYYVITPDTRSSDGTYPLLIALPDGQENSSAMLRHFTAIAHAYDVTLLIPDFTSYLFTEVDAETATLHEMIKQVADVYPLSERGVTLFGFGNGGAVATHYASLHPDLTASVITSGSTYLFPPVDDVTYTIIYGAEDDLLRGLTENYAPFANLTDWKTPLNFLTIENIGHEINSQQIDIIKQVLLDVYQ